LPTLISTICKVPSDEPTLLKNNYMKQKLLAHLENIQYPQQILYDKYIFRFLTNLNMFNYFQKFKYAPYNFQLRVVQFYDDSNQEQNLKINFVILFLWQIISF
jgi:hypothetical protein